MMTLSTVLYVMFVVVLVPSMACTVGGVSIASEGDSCYSGDQCVTYVLIIYIFKHI